MCLWNRPKKAAGARPGTRAARTGGEGGDSEKVTALEKALHEMKVHTALFDFLVFLSMHILY